MVQVALNNNPPTRLPLLKVDGVFGAKTEARVREFQRNRNLTPDGVVGADTRAALGLQIALPQCDEREAAAVEPDPKP